MRSKSRRMLGFIGKRPLSLALAGSAWLGGTSLASAQTGAPQVVQPRPAPAEQAQQTRSYGWQTAVVDAAAVGFLVGGLATMDICISPCPSNPTSATLLMFGLATYGAGAPLVHGGHRRWGTAAASLGLRVAPFAIGGSLMAADEGAGASILVAGMVTAMLVDASVLARKPVPVPSASERLQLTPVVDPRRRAGFVFVTRDF